MGGGGQLDGSVVSNANTALYTTFAVFGFGAGTFLNYYGARLTMVIGGFGYCGLSLLPVIFMLLAFPVFVAFPAFFVFFAFPAISFPRMLIPPHGS